MSERQSPYLKFVSGLSRIIGYLFICVGLLIALSFVGLRCEGKVDFLTAAISVGAGLVCAVLGFLVINAKPIK
jgi:hypothetical protein